MISEAEEIFLKEMKQKFRRIDSVVNTKISELAKQINTREVFVYYRIMIEDVRTLPCFLSYALGYQYQSVINAHFKARRAINFDFTDLVKKYYPTLETFSYWENRSIKTVFLDEDLRAEIEKIDVLCAFCDKVINFSDNEYIREKKSKYQNIYFCNLDCQEMAKMLRVKGVIEE